MKKSKKIIILIIIIIAVGGTIAGAILKSRQPQETMPKVKACKVEKKPMVETLSATGTFIPAEIETHLSDRIARVEQVYHDVGEYVTEGTLILEMEKTNYLRNLEKANVALVTARRKVNIELITYQSQYDQAKIALNNAKRHFKKQKELFELQAISEEDFEAARDKLTLAEEAHETLRRKFNISLGLLPHCEPDLKTVKIEDIVESTPEVVSTRIARDVAQDIYDKCKLRAKTNGTITKLPYKEQNYTIEGAVLAEIQTLDKLNVKVVVDEVDIGKIHVGDEVDITSDSILGEVFHGNITTISPIVEEIGQSQASWVEIEPTDPPAVLFSGASCTVKITTVSKENCLTIPASTIRTAKGDIMTFYLEDLGNGTYEVHDIVIETGLSSIHDIEVLSELKEGDLVAENTDDFLREGLVVELESDDDKD